MTPRQTLIWLLCCASGFVGMFIGIRCEDSEWEGRAQHAEAELESCDALWSDCFEDVLYICNQDLWPATLCRLDDRENSTYCKRCAKSVAWREP
jgi:hypothetical protein